MIKELKKLIRHFWIDITGKNKLKIISGKKTFGSKGFYLIYVTEPDIDRLLAIGFVRDKNRGYRYQYKNNKHSIHILPTGNGWQVHIDRSIAGKRHRVKKSKKASQYIQGFVNRYRYCSCG